MGGKPANIILAALLRRQFSFVSQMEVTIIEDRVEFFSGITRFSRGPGHFAVNAYFRLVLLEAPIFYFCFSFPD